MAELLRVAFGHTGWVNVLNNDSVFIAYRMGNTLLMTHHSDKCRPSPLAHVTTNHFRKDYGETEHHYIDVGHVHHGMVMKEHPDIFVEPFNHLASLDKWAHDAGYRNRKSITIVLRYKTYGKVGRRVLPIQEVRARLGRACIAAPESREVYTV
jgi:DNA repair exonuclease SbcCD nuclease subunit